MIGRSDDTRQWTPEDLNSEVLSTTGETFGPTLPAGSMNDWGSWFQNIGTAVVQTGLNTYQYQQIGQNGGVPAISPRGNVYTEGQRAPGVAYGPGAANSGMGISPVLLIGAAVAVAALLLLRK